MKNIFTILLLVIFSFSLQAQNKAILKPNGELIHVKGSLQDAIRMKGDARFVQPITSSAYSTLGTIDTISYNDYFITPGVNFGMASQDCLAQYFVVPAELTALAVGFLPLEWNGNFGNGNPFAEVKIVKCNWTAEEFESYASGGAAPVGYFLADGNLPNPIT
ncbi:MAG: hypothetical protein K9J16_12715, partial [Melioribacteraceae bacterium]|nr:hypothetical protein [Melioribacteraceae bacterium]MCF8394697.1 hypothetical protein [Melioribacteraceae bacterium]MCF8420225.1 hypothetical protein [Melioribacteraceae bacterium]